MNPLVNMILLQDLKSWWGHNLAYYDEFRKIINDRRKKNLPSLRGIEFVVTQTPQRSGGFYSRRNGGRVYVNIHDMYKTALLTHGKRHFDSFRRQKALLFSVPQRENQPINTTIAQLLWGKWIYDYRIMPHVKANWTTVRRQMAISLKEQRTRKKCGQAHKKKHKANIQQIHTGKIILKW